MQSSPQPRLASPPGDLAARYDVVVIGSGYGGSVAALRFAERGLNVAILERGREFVTGEFPGRMPDLRRELQVTGARGRMGVADGLFDMRLGDDMHVLVGCGVGGGSLINAGVALRPDPRVFDDPVWPGQIRQDGDLDEGYARARHWLRPATDPQAAEMTKFAALEKSSVAVGTAPEAAEVVVNFAESTNAAGITQPACTRCGDCCAGCNVGAKNTLPLTYLAAASRAGVRIFERITVSHVARALTPRKPAWEVFARPTGGKPNGSDAATPIRIAADQVVFAAGSLGTTEILLRSARNGLPLSDRLGKRFSANGDIIAFGMSSREPVRAVGVGHPGKAGIAPVGASVSGQIKCRDSEDLTREMTIQEGVLPSALAPLLPVFFLPGGRLLGAAEALIKGVYKGPLAHLNTYFVVSHDGAGGHLQLDGEDRIRLSWPDAATEPVHARVDAALTALVEENGGRYVKSPLAMTSVGAKPATAHPLGGAGMGATVRAGVVDHAGRVFDATSTTSDTATYDGLYVLDGAQIPRSLGCNPLLTITALAERAMLKVA